MFELLLDAEELDQLILYLLSSLLVTFQVPRSAVQNMKDSPCQMCSVVVVFFVFYSGE